MEVDPAKLFLGDDSSFVEFHRPSYYSSEFFAVHSQFVEERRYVAHLFVSYHYVGVEAPRVVVAELSRHGSVWGSGVVEGDEAGVCASRP